MVEKNSVLHAILKWSETQDEWVLDALGRIFRGDQITNADIARYVTSLLSDQPPEGFRPLLETELPAGADGNEDLFLVSIGNLEGINRMSPGHILEFGPGLSIIYGTNGAGKSGYCRVLKRACRSRGATPEILGDMLSDSTQEQKASIKFRTKGETSEVNWVSDKIGIDSLGNVFVFDSTTAQNYVSTSDKASFTPFGLDILPKLVPVMDQVQANLNEQKKALLAEIEAIRRTLAYKPNTETAKYIASVSAKSNKLKLQQLASLSEQELAREKLLVDLLNKDPAIEAERTSNSRIRIQSFMQKTNTVLSQFGPSNVSELQDFVESLSKSREVAESIRKRRYLTAILPGTGNVNNWRPLWDAAFDFSTKSAYPSRTFPVVNGDALCVLCQKPLEESGTNRMLDFQRSVEAKEERALGELERKGHEKDQALRALPSIVAEVKSIIADLEAGLRTEIDKVNLLALSIDEQISKIRLSLRDLNTIAVVMPEASVLERLSAHLEDLNALENTQRMAIDPEDRKRLQSELAELQERKKLAVQRESVLQVIENYRKAARIEDLVKETKTANVTKFYGQLAVDWITEPFRQHFNKELDRLGLATIRPVLETANSKGQVYYNLSLREGISQKLMNIASEGEQRCIALAGFLAELGQASHRSAILFDDPVSSLDHLYQERVAERLSQESTERQVIVFTHDIAFLHQLLRWQERHHREPTVRHVEWDGNTRRPGAVRDQLPWNLQPIRQQIHHLKERHRHLESSWVPVPTEENNRDMESSYSLLRSAIERAVEETIFSGIVERFNDQVIVGRVVELAGLPEELLANLKNLHFTCHEIVDAHTKPIISRPTLRNPKQFMEDILALEAICEGLKEHRKQRSKHA